MKCHKSIQYIHVVYLNEGHFSTFLYTGSPSSPRPCPRICLRGTFTPVPVPAGEKSPNLGPCGDPIKWRILTFLILANHLGKKTRN